MLTEEKTGDMTTKAIGWEYYDHTVSFNGSTKIPYKVITPNDPDAPGPVVLMPDGPKPIYDLIYTGTGATLRADEHYIPSDGVTKSSELHKRFVESGKTRRGRKQVELKLSDVRKYRQAYYGGRMKATEIESATGLTAGTVRNFLTGVTYWYA
jgi:hypothetical protein